MSKEPPNKEEPGLTQVQEKYLQIGCLIVWLACLWPMAMLIAIFAVCGPTAFTGPTGVTGSGINLGYLLLAVGFGLLLVLTTAVVFDKNKKP